MTPVEPSSWLQAFRIYTHPRVLGMLSLGFSAGLPLLLILGTLSFWLREAGIDRSTIGHLSWIGLAYGFKWLWAPLVDRLPLPLLTRLLGRRRAWLLLSQIIIAIALMGMATTDPLENLTYMVFLHWQWPSPRPPKILHLMPTALKPLPRDCKERWPPPIRRVIAWR